jgi:2-isopropylmalate synthase
MEQVKLYDTTLRDGMQGEGMSLSAAEKARVVKALDGLGVQMIEAGFPSSNPKEEELFAALAELPLERAVICGFGMTRRRGVEAGEDPALITLVDSFAPVVTLVGKTWGLHLEKVTKVSREENLAMIAESVAFCRERGYALSCLEAAIDAGAENVTLCDTNGASLPDQVAAGTEVSVARFGERAEIGIHAHDDAGCGVANSLAAVNAGARMVQGTVNGYGERCGNANLTSVLPALQLKMGFEVVPAGKLETLTDTVHFIDELCNLTPNPNAPYVGRNAFAHKGGIHVAGIEAEARSYEHVEPAAVGNERAILPSELSGKATIRDQARAYGIEIDDEGASRAIEVLKDREHRGYHYEAAPASFELLLRNEAGVYKPLFELESYRVVTQRRAGGEVETEATVRLHIDGERYVEIAEGNGPVSALDKALRQAITSRHPQLAEIELTNYKVRILDQDRGTDAVTRVLLDSADGEREWGTTGVSGNVIEASWQALVDSLEYAFQ